jgi:hypothetical protein
MSRRRDHGAKIGAALGAAALLALAGAGCGRKAPPRPPQYVIPQSPDPVVVESSPDGVKLSWRRPREYVDGQPLGDLAGFRVRRACQPEIQFSEIASVAVTDQQRFRKANSFSMLDSDAPLGIPCRYQVIAFTFDEYTSPPAESEDVVRTVPGAAP